MRSTCSSDWDPRDNIIDTTQTISSHTLTKMVCAGSQTVTSQSWTSHKMSTYLLTTKTAQAKSCATNVKTNHGCKSATSIFTGRKSAATSIKWSKWKKLVLKHQEAEEYQEENRI